LKLGLPGETPEKWPKHMPIDARDQEIINSLPRLADVYEAYGVQVNALPV